MEKKLLLNENFIINKPVLSVRVSSTVYDPIHIDRPSHGFAIHPHGGKTYHFYDGKTLKVEPGNIIYMPKGSSYEVKATIKAHCYAMNFDIDADIDCEPFVFKPKDPAEMLAIFKSSEKAWRTREIGYVEKFYSALYEIISIMKNESGERYVPGSREAIIAPAVKFISENYTSERISTGELAERCGISEAYLRRLFSSFYGKSPVEYINALKLERGKELLQSGEYSVSDAARECGFSDECYFSRKFKEFFGFPPIMAKKRDG